jgi:hypothetical protein
MEAAVAARGFACEADMLGDIGAAAEALAGSGAVAVFEVPSAAGIPDVVAAVLDADALAARLRTGFVVEPPMLAAILALSRGLTAGAALPVADVAAHASVTSSYAAAKVLPALADRGLAERAGSGSWMATGLWSSAATRVVTVEAKLRDWRRGLAQAIRHASGADEAWLVLDAAAARRADAYRAVFEVRGVGLAALDDGGALEPLVAPSGQAEVLPLRRELLAERVAALYCSGQTSGPVGRVFGRHLWAVTRPDPRLAGAADR